jgi:hypothetical protein
MTIAEKLLLLATKLKDFKSFVEIEIASLKASISSISFKEGLAGPAGKEGRAGRDGSDGVFGKDGVDGKKGLDGKDGVSVVDASVAFDGSLVLSLSDGTVIDAGTVVSANSRTGDMTVFKSGAVQVSKYTATPLAIAGFVEITDVDGITRKLAVVE